MPIIHASSHDSVRKEWCNQHDVEEIECLELQEICDDVADKEKADNFDWTRDEDPELVVWSKADDRGTEDLILPDRAAVDAFRSYLDKRLEKEQEPEFESWGE